MQKTYSLQSVIMTINGVPVSGFAEGDAVTYAPDGPKYTTTTGADGETLRSRNNNRNGTFTFNLLYSSLSNNHFALQAALDDLSNMGSFAMKIMDTRSGTSYFSASAWVEEEPDETWGEEAGSRSWVVKATKVKTIVAGIIGLGGRAI